MTRHQDTLGVLTEAPFDGFELSRYHEYLPAHGLPVEYSQSLPTLPGPGRLPIP